MPAAAAVRLTGLTRSFGATRALDGADLTLRPGTVHALLGGNGSGKSTAIKILAGAYLADGGTIEVGASVFEATGYTARLGRDAGLRFVHQDLGLFGELSIAENFALDHGWPTAAGARIRWSVLRARVAALLERYEIDASPDAPVGELRPAQRTMVAIARAVQDDEGVDRVLILDEPTAALPQHESELLLRSVRRRADLGQTVLIVSHRMQEVLSVADDYTIFRDGRTVARLVDATPTEDELISHMTGRAVSRAGACDTPDAADPARDTPDLVLEVRELVSGPLAGVDLSVRAGEVVGIAGLVGSGRTSLLKTIFGQHAPAAGVIRIAGREQGSRDAVGRRMAEGVAYLPEDRLGEAALNGLTVVENLSASVLRSFWGLWGMSRRAERDQAGGLVGRFKIKTASIDAVFGALSGGNQQKVILARWLRRRPRLLLLDEPTQGVDVMSRRDIYAAIRDAAAQGCAVLVTSSDFVELCTLCDRVVVLQKGRTAAQVAGAALTVDHLTALTQSAVLIEGANL